MIADVVPGMDALLEAAPESGGLDSAVGGLSSTLVGGAEKLGGLASLASGFERLGLDSDMVGKFIPIILSFFKSREHDSVAHLLEGVLQ